MSQYGVLICPETRETIWLGKAVFESELSESISFFHIGDDRSPRNWQREMMNQSIWKFLADRVGKELRVVLDWELEQDDRFEESVEIGGDTIYDIDFSDYLKGWPGR